MCRHGHSYLEHYSCFLAEAPETAPMQENIGIFDAEMTGLKANWSHMLSWCMKEHDKDVIHHDVVTPREARDKNDRRIIKSAVAEIKKYDRICGYYSSRFDIPYLRSRALYHGIEFPAYRDIYHTDLYYVARSKFALHSNRLQAVCEYFGIPAKGHRMTPELWQQAGAGKKEALDTILLHNKEDVESTDAVFKMLLKHTMLAKRSV
jgi:uncharacterized protein YprB with RNaseH-like and TPR domain